MATMDRFLGIHDPPFAVKVYKSSLVNTQSRV